MNVLFFHGGPGLNSNPEKNILTEKFSTNGYSLKCWNEPSVLRSTNKNNQEVTYENYLNSAENFLLENYDGNPQIIIGHSFGVHAVLHLAKTQPQKIKQIVVVASNLSVQDTDLNTFSFSAADFEKHQESENAKSLLSIIDQYTGLFDENTQKGFTIVSQNPRLFNSYWYNKELMPQFLSHYTSPEYTLDVESYFTIRKTWNEHENNEKSSIPVIAIYGKHDIIVTNQKERLIVKEKFLNANFYEFEYSSHYPHIEETDELLHLLKKSISITQ